MYCRKFIVVIFLASFFGAAASAKQPYRLWQTGRLARLEPGSCGFFPKCLQLSIETQQYLYVCKWSTGRTGRWQKYPYFRIVGPVQFAIENNELYIKGIRGKQYKTRLLERVPIPDRSSYPPELKAGIHPGETKSSV